MPDPLTRADLDQAQCQVFGCDHAHDAEGLVLNPVCHPRGRTEVSYCAGVLTIVCGQCKKFVAHIAVAPGPEDDTGFDLSQAQRYLR